LTTDEREVVAVLGKAIAQRIGEPRYNLWFARNTKFTWNEDHLVVGVPNHLVQEWLQKTFTDDVRAAASTVLARPMQVRFAIDPELFRAARSAQAKASVTRETKFPSRPAIECDSPEAPPPHQLQVKVRDSRSAKLGSRRWRQLSEFVVGGCNRVAYASALSIVEAPGEAVNPLVLHGPVGTGKTHLLEGIRTGLHKHHPDWSICYVTTEEFTNRFVQAMRLGKLGAFRKYFRECDVLLADDVHFLASKRATQEEFLHTFDVLQAHGKQLVVSCDCHPRLTEEFTPELRDRLLGGAVWGLTPPDRATCLDILHSKAARAAIPLPDGVLCFLADHLHGNVRELEGALHSIQHYSRVADRAIDLDLAREALSDVLRHSVRTVSLEDVDRAVCRTLRLETGALQLKQRAWMVSHPRMLAMYIARKHTSAPYSEIGRHFGGRNHSTAVAAEKKIRDWLRQDGQLVLGGQRLKIRDAVDLVERELRR
jgi:chromosomal replication initiator protein